MGMVFSLFLLHAQPGRPMPMLHTSHRIPQSMATERTAARSWLNAVIERIQESA